MFTDILNSGQLSSDRLFTTTLSKTSLSLPEWLIVRILMRTKYQYFSSEHGYILNLFDVDPESVSTNSFLLVDCLDLLYARRKTRGELGIEGYVWVKRLVQELTGGYIPEDIFWALETLLEHGLISADHLRTKGIKPDDYVKISASGFVHPRMLLRRLEYLSAAATDCWYRDRSAAEEVLQTLHEDLLESQPRGKRRRAYLLEKSLSDEAKKIVALTHGELRGAEIIREAFDDLRGFQSQKLAQDQFELK